MAQKPFTKVTAPKSRMSTNSIMPADMSGRASCRLLYFITGAGGLSMRRRVLRVSCGHGKGLPADRQSASRIQERLSEAERRTDALRSRPGRKRVCPCQLTLLLQHYTLRFRPQSALSHCPRYSSFVIIMWRNPSFTPSSRKPALRWVSHAAISFRATSKSLWILEMPQTRKA